MISMKPITCGNAAINQLTTIDTNQLYDYDSINTQQCNDSLPQSFMN